MSERVELLEQLYQALTANVPPETVPTRLIPIIAKIDALGFGVPRKVAVFDLNPGRPVAYLRAQSLENPKACVHEVRGRNGDECRENAVKEHLERCGHA